MPNQNKYQRRESKFVRAMNKESLNKHAHLLNKPILIGNNQKSSTTTLKCEDPVSEPELSRNQSTKGVSVNLKTVLLFMITMSMLLETADADTNQCKKALGYIYRECGDISKPLTKTQTGLLFSPTCYFMLLEAVDACELQHCQILSTELGGFCTVNTREIISRVSTIHSYFNACGLGKQKLKDRLTFWDSVSHSACDPRNIKLFEECHMLHSQFERFLPPML